MRNVLQILDVATKTDNPSALIASAIALLEGVETNRAQQARKVLQKAEETGTGHEALMAGARALLEEVA